MLTDLISITTLSSANFILTQQLILGPAPLHTSNIRCHITSQSDILINSCVVCICVQVMQVGNPFMANIYQRDRQVLQDEYLWLFLLDNLMED